MTDSDAFTINTKFCRFCDQILVGRCKDGVNALIDTVPLDHIADDLAQEESLRLQMGVNNPSIWPAFHRTWDTLAERVPSNEDHAPTRLLITSFSRFTRNLVAAVPRNQQNAFASEPSLRRILHAYSSWSATQDEQSYAATRMLTQTLSNMVTSNDGLMARLWETYFNLPQEQVILIRLLASPDTRTILPLLVLLINCIYQSDYRKGLLAETKVGARICIALLDRMVTLYDADDSSDGGKAFDYGYHLFEHLFDDGFAPKLHANLKVMDEIVAPHQITLLKLLDSYFHSLHSQTAIIGMCPMLTSYFFELCTFSIQAVEGLVEPRLAGNTTDSHDNLSGHRTFDSLLPKACEALVLVAQCLVSALLEFEENKSKGDMLLIRGATSSHGQDMAVCAIELLRLLDVFVPRINFGKPVPSARPLRGSPGINEPTGFSYVKRDLVRLLGVLCHKDRKMQDSIRNNEGIAVIMNMCVIDECNPYLREHAIFTLHNILEGNEENQNVVANIQPLEKWDQNGMLQR